MMREKPKIVWRDYRRNGQIEQRAIFQIGDFQCLVQFYLHHGRWNRGWGIENDEGERGTGLFPVIDKCLKKITERFLLDHNPPSLFIYGADAKRNNWNADHYMRYRVPLPYDYFVIKNRKSIRCGNGGIVGVGWIREKEMPKPHEFTSENDVMSLV
jgi:hypothetical protein